ncbi:MAG: PH domain-containing protein [Rubrobacteraceae bacterium]
MKAEPAERLDPRAKKLWRISNALWNAPLLILAGAVGWFLVWRLDFSILIGVLPLLTMTVFYGLVVGVLPPLRWRRWRYEIREEEVDLQRGIIWVSRTLVPLARIQHVDTQNGPLQRWFGLSTVIFYTAAGSNHIPELAAPVAAEVRDRISELTREQDEL